MEGFGLSGRGTPIFWKKVGFSNASSSPTFLNEKVFDCWNGCLVVKDGIRSGVGVGELVTKGREVEEKNGIGVVSTNSFSVVSGANVVDTNGVGLVIGTLPIELDWKLLVGCLLSINPGIGDAENC